MLTILLASLSALLAALPTVGPHQGLLAPEGAQVFELVVGPERLALYVLAPDLTTHAATPSDQATLFTAGHPALKLLPAGDHFEVDNTFGVNNPLTFAAVVQTPSGSSAVRFQFTPEATSTFHDHRPYHGGVVGMVGERHMELAVVGVGDQAELQLYVTDAYRRPIPTDGLKASATLGGGKPFALTASADCFVGRFTRGKGPLDVHTEVVVPREPEPVAMDFYLEPEAPDHLPRKGPIEVRVGSAGFSPPRIEVTAEAPLRLRFLRTSAQTCGKQVVFPSLGITRDLPLNKPVDIDLVPPRGELAFTCGMHMLRGAVVGL